MGVLQGLLHLCLLFSAISSLQWSASPADGDTVFTCVGQDVTLPFTFNLSAGEEITSMEWLFKGSSQELVAMYSHGTFVALPAFSNRVQHVDFGSLTISQVTSVDAGSYTIEINGRDNLYANRTFVLKVSAGLPTTDGRLHVTLLPNAVLDPASQQWSVVLTCGQFLFTGQPPLAVEWVTPSGAIMSGSNYTAGDFSLLLVSPVQWGLYVCRIPQQHLSSACLHGNQNGPAPQASVEVDGTEVRIMLMEAELGALRHDKQQTQQQLLELQDGQQLLLQQLLAMYDSQNGASDHVTPQVTLGLQTDVSQLRQELVDVNRTLTQQVSRLEMAQLADNASLGGATPQVSFNALSSQPQYVIYPNHVQFDQVLHSLGDAFNSTTGDFVAPVSGTYVFIFHAQSEPDHDASSSIKVNDEEVCYAYITDGDEHGSCPAVVHLGLGDTVWVEPMGGMFYQRYSTSFVGFLLSADPL